MLCDGPVTSVPTAEWSDSQDEDVQRRFTALLNFTLRAAHYDELVWHLKKKVVYYQASSDLSKRKVRGRYRGSKGRAFFTPYHGKDDVTRVRFCRHYAAGLYFRRWAGQWFLEINPTYHFTIDGRRDSYYDAEYVAKIKRMERNNAVYQLVRAWADYLHGEDTLFKSRDERILFGSLLTVDTDAAIDEKAWLPPPDPPVPAPADSGPAGGSVGPAVKAHVLSEPELEFRARNRHIDPRYGVAVYGPANADAPSAPRDIPVGLVGPSSAVDGMRGWLERCRTRIEAKEAKPGQENLHQPFPGFSTDTNFGAGLVFDDALIREIPDRRLRLLARADVKAAIAEGAALYADAARSLAETGRCRVILCARPEEIREHDSDASGPPDGAADSEEDHSETEIGRDFHDLLKAQSLGLACPLQVMRRETWEGTVTGSDVPRLLQDGHQPARIVLHKTSQFSPAEVSGFQGAADDREIDFLELIWIQRRGAPHLFRTGQLPPLRGTSVQLDPRTLLLYTRGSVPYFRTYPGLYVPQPLLLRPAGDGTDLQATGTEVLALSKMNWNNAQLDERDPLTLRTAHRVGGILRHVPPDAQIATRYAYYM